jgi:hypothetical protein
MWQLVQVTAQYSNAVLLAVMPYVSDFSKKLDLALPRPVPPSQVVEFKCDPRLGQTGGALTLSNGFQFAFLEGRVCLYRSPQSYFSLQDPEEIPRFYGPVKIKEKEALQIARDTIKKLGYENAAFNADTQPLITRPEKIGTNYIPRFRFRWLDPKWPKPKDTDAIIPSLLDVEVNASNRQVEMWITSSRDTFRPSPKVGVAPPLLNPQSTKPRLIGGRQTEAVSEAYARAFLNAILPQISDFVAKAGIDVPFPVTTNQVVATNYACRIQDGQPLAQLYLTNGDRFNYQHGHVEAFYAHDAMDKFPETGRAEDFLGHINTTKNEAISICESVMKKLGYKDQLPTPIISYAPARGTLVCTRFTYYWKHPDQDFPFASFEVDMENKTIKSIFLRDPVFEKESPKTDMPPEPESTK